MDERELATRMLENTAAARRNVYECEERYLKVKAEERQNGHERNIAVSKGAALIGATAIAAETFDIPIGWQLPAYGIASLHFIEASVCQYFKSQYRAIASENAKNTYEFNKKDFVGLPTPEWIKKDPTYKRFKGT